MLVPAILYKDKIIREMQKYFYTDDMLYETGCMHNWCPDIAEEPNEKMMQYAIVSGETLIGYLGYSIDWYVSKAYNFGLFSFDRGNPLIGKDLYSELERLVNKFHRVEWRMVGGNPAERGYDHFVKKHNGTKHILRDAIRDRDGNYRNDIIYEIVKGGGVAEDVCEWKSAHNGEFIQNPHTKRLYSNEPSMKNVYCNTCGKKIKEVE